MLSQEDLAARPPRTRITLETCYATASVETAQNDMSLHELWDELIAPVLQAVGYGEEPVKELTGR
jgi:hypothetical protein